MADDVTNRLLRAPSVQAFDVDAAGRLLVGNDGSGSVQLYEVDQELSWRQLTDLGESASGRYVPASRTVVVEHAVGGNERGQLSTIDLDEAAGQLPALHPLVHDPAYMHRLVDTAAGTVLYLTNRRDGVEFDLIQRDLASGGERVLYDGGGYVMDAAASPNGEWVVLTRPTVTSHAFQVLLVSTKDGTVHEVTGQADDGIATDPRWLPDSSAFLISTNTGREVQGVARVDVDGDRALHYVATSPDHDLNGWPSPRGDRMLVAANDDGRVGLTLHSLPDGAPVATVDLPGDGCAAMHRYAPPMWSADARFAAFTYTSPVHPAYVIRYDAVTGNTTGIVAPDSAGLPDGLVAPTSHRVPAPDGEQIPVFVFRPETPDGTAVMVVHGGPEGQSMQEWNPVVQALVSQGHTVLVPNVRGSTGYGKRWYTMDDVRRRLDSVADLAAIHDWLPTVGVDPARVALYGGSYGGYMVLAGLTFQPERWAAGVDIVGIASLVTFLENTSAYRRSYREREYGSLAADRDFLAEVSPLTHIDAIRAPLFVIHGANDPRVPLSEAEQITAALAERGIEYTLKVYPDEGHGLAKLANKLDAYPEALAFLARHL